LLFTNTEASATNLEERKPSRQLSFYGFTSLDEKLNEKKRMPVFRGLGDTGDPGVVGVVGEKM